MSVEINTDEALKQKQDLIRKLDSKDNYTVDGNFDEVTFEKDKKKLAELNGQVEQKTEQIVEEATEVIVEDDHQTQGEELPVQEATDIKSLKKQTKSEYDELVEKYRQTLDALKSLVEAKKNFREKVLKPMYANKEMTFEELQELRKQL